MAGKKPWLIVELGRYPIDLTIALDGYVTNYQRVRSGKHTKNDGKIHHATGKRETHA